MSRIKDKDTSLELSVRKYLYYHGFRYRKNVKELPGKPDIVLYKYNVAIFVNGCFWHHHYNCKYSHMPKSRSEYWMKKLDRNIENDVRNHNLLKQMGYRVIVVWECELKDCFDYRMEQLVEEITNNIDGENTY